MKAPLTYLEHLEANKHKLEYGETPEKINLKLKRSRAAKRGHVRLGNNGFRN